MNTPEHGLCPEKSATNNRPWEVRGEDRDFYDRELDSFVPERVFDAHAHFYQRKHSLIIDPGMPDAVGFPECGPLFDALHPGRNVAGLFIPIAKIGHFRQANQWIADQIAGNDLCRGLFFVHPEDDPEWVREEVRRLGLHGLKCYHTCAARQPTWESDIPDYLPENLVKVADEEGWVITLHMVKSRAAADESNQHWIRYFCENYPNMKLILAHSARGFQPGHNIEGLPKLVGLDNLYFDTSANCEPLAHQVILRYFGHKRLLYGSDSPVSHMRGRSAAAVDSFIWLYPNTATWKTTYANIEPVLVGLEHLRSLKWACWSERLDDSAVEDIFWNNAAALFEVQYK
ncbi:MAG: amidohydrolase family protein [Pirellulales bacterium]|nr:amidohydrolase family protein [Pirellulales bacterium]